MKVTATIEVEYEVDPKEFPDDMPINDKAMLALQDILPVKWCGFEVTNIQI